VNIKHIMIAFDSEGITVRTCLRYYIGESVERAENFDDAVRRVRELYAAADKEAEQK